MKTKTIKIYECSELSPEAFKKAHEKWNETNDSLPLQSMLNDECGQILKKHGVKCDSNHPVCLFSLGHSQGDGLMFEGRFTWKGWKITIKHAGHYYHERSKTIDMVKERGVKEYYPDKKTEDTFDALYIKICRSLAKLGYSLIEDEQSEAHFIDECNANEWMFTADGRIQN